MMEEKKNFGSFPLPSTPTTPSTSLSELSSRSSQKFPQFTKIDVLKNLRLLENRLCADCSSPLSNQQMIYGSLTYGVWLCHICAHIHQKILLNPNSNIKSTTEQWDEMEIQHMVKLGSNIHINEHLERYIPLGWNKCTPTSTNVERELWIRAKYDSRLFTFPSISHQPSQEYIARLPLRLLDYFVIVSIGECIDKNLTESFSLESIQFLPEIKLCYPGENYYTDATLPDQLGTFIYPSGISLSSDDKQPSFFTFVLTDVNAVKMYGGVLHIFELIESDEINNLIQNSKDNSSATLGVPTPRHCYRPKALVLLSHYPFYNLLRLLLLQLYRISLSSSPLPFDKYLANIFEIPLPPYGLTEILYHGLPGCPLLIYRPPRNQLPMIDYSFRPLFLSLSVENILLLFSYILNEHKVCFCSKHLSILTPVQEAFLSFIFPFVWQGAYIPIIPNSMKIILDAPVPFIVGIDSECLPGFGTASYQIPDGLVMVDLDNDQLYFGVDLDGKKLEPCELPSRELSKLRETLVRHGGCIYGHKQQTNFHESCLPFRNNEHLIPLDLSSFESGHLLNSTHKLNIYDTIVRSAETKVQVNFQCTVSLCVNVNVVTDHSPATSKQPMSRSSMRVKDEGIQMDNFFSSSLFSPSNNCSRTALNTPNGIGGSDDSFDVKEIRYAFLRFFISVLRDYQQFLEEINKNTTNSGLKNKHKSQTFYSQSFLTALFDSFFTLSNLFSLLDLKHKCFLNLLKKEKLVQINLKLIFLQNVLLINLIEVKKL